jgi:hypothetical protein
MMVLKLQAEAIVGNLTDQIVSVIDQDVFD